MGFRSSIAANCASCGLVFQIPRSWKYQAECVCPDCNATNPVPKRPWINCGRVLLALGLCAALAAVGYGVSRIRSRDGEAWALRELADREFRDEHYARALELFDTLARRESPSPESQFRRAQCMAALGQRSKARRVVEETLSQAGSDWLPHNSLVIADIHFWLAQEIYSRPQVTRAQWQLAKTHLCKVLDFVPHHETARRMLLAMHQASGNQAEALIHLEALARSSTADRMSLAIAYARLGKGSDAKIEAERAYASLLVEICDSPTNSSLRRQAAQAALLANDFAAAEEQLGRAFSDVGCDDPQTVALWGEMCEIHARQVLRDRREWPLRLLELCRKSLERSPCRAQTYELLRPLLARSDEVGTEARGLLMLGLARGCDPVALHGLLAERASLLGRGTESIQHWRVVVAFRPEWSGALNNLAWELCWSDPPQLEDALSCADRALQLKPDSEAIRETRGQILARAGRSREALPDLLSALAEFPENARLHATLSDVYRDLNSPEQAVLHANRANELLPAAQVEPVRQSRDE